MFFYTDHEIPACQPQGYTTLSHNAVMYTTEANAKYLLLTSFYFLGQSICGESNSFEVQVHLSSHT